MFLQLPTGQWVAAQLSGIVPTKNSDGTYTLTAPAPAAPVTFIENEKPAQSPGNSLVYMLSKPPAAASLKVYRNGLRQRETVDYTLSGQAITFIDYYKDDPAALVTVDYRTP